MGFERREEGRATLCVLMLQRTTALTKENPPLGLAGFNYRLWKSVQVCVVERDGGINRLSNWS